MKNEARKRKPDEEIVYQIYPASFKDSNGDGIGDLQGIIEKLDVLQDLGVTMLWLCPVYPSPMEDNGYDVADYMDIHPEFGTMEDMDRLIEEAAKRDMELMMDLVLNHTSSQHPWFQKALEDPESEEHGYYIFRTADSEPDNLRSVFGGSVWEKVPGRNEYYFHSFGKGQPDLNWDNPDLRKKIYQMIDFWIRKGICAFRMDAINFIKKPDPSETWPDLLPDGSDGRIKCTTIVRNHEGLLGYLHEMTETCFQKNGIMTVAETAGLPYEQLSDYIGENGCFSMVFDFRHADLDIASGDEWFTRLDWTVQDLKERLERTQTEIQKYGLGATFLENHDQPRATTKYLGKHQNNPDAVRMLAMLQLGMRGVPFIYQGQELGMVNFERTRKDQFSDLSSIDQLERACENGCTPEEALYYVNLRSRDNARVPYPWNRKRYGGFSCHQPWLECNQQAEKMGICLSEQRSDPESIFSFYRELIALRKDSDWSEILCDGKIEFVNSHPEVIAYTRELNDRKILVLCSFSENGLKTPCENGVLIEDSTRENQRGKRVQTENRKIALKPFQALMLETD